MPYLITQIVLFLIGAYVLGLLTGWALWRRSEPTAADADGRLAECTSKLDDARSTIRNLERKVATLQSEPTTHFPVPDAASGATSAVAAGTASAGAAAASAVASGDAATAPEADAPETALSGDALLAGGPAGAAFLDDASPVSPAHETPADRDLLASGDDAAPEATAGDTGSPAYDDLKRISGIGATIERQLAEIGITTYRQIAHFSDEDIERVGAHIDFFPDRIRREGWVVQAAALHRETYGTQP